MQGKPYQDRVMAYIWVFRSWYCTGGDERLGQVLAEGSSITEEEGDGRWEDSSKGLYFGLNKRRREQTVGTTQRID